MDYEKAKNATMKIMLQSFVYYVNEVISEDFTEEEQERLVNIVFNVMTNSLYPDTSLMWNNAIFSTVKQIKEYDEKMEKKETIDLIYSELGWNSDD